MYPAFNNWCIYCHTPLQFLLPLIYSLPHPLSPLSISVRITYPAYILFTLYFIPSLWTHVHLCQNFCILSLYLIRVIGSWQPFLCLVSLQTATTNLAPLHPLTPWLQRRCVGQVPMNSWKFMNKSVVKWPLRSCTDSSYNPTCLAERLAGFRAIIVSVDVTTH